MEIITTVENMRRWVQNIKSHNKRVGFVPTMGFLHAGHLSLVKKLQREADRVVVSIFVNPTQFNDPKDFEKYPIDLDRDCQLLQEAGVDAVFLPNVEMLYGDRKRFQSWVEVSSLSQPLEGAHRPGHFRGVTTIVTILFNCVPADVAAFGEKDFQQLRLIEQMVKDLKMPIAIVRGETVREQDNLAMSSRNVRLSAEGRQSALGISKGLFAARAAYAEGTRDAESLCSVVAEQLSMSGIEEVDYIALVDDEYLQPVREAKNTNRLLVAAFVDGVRLIDNVGL